MKSLTKRDRENLTKVLQGLEEEAKSVEKAAIRETLTSQIIAYKARHARITRRINGLKRRLEEYA